MMGSRREISFARGGSLSINITTQREPGSLGGKAIAMWGKSKSNYDYREISLFVNRHGQTNFRVAPRISKTRTHSRIDIGRAALPALLVVGGQGYSIGSLGGGDSNLPRR